MKRMLRKLTRCGGLGFQPHFSAPSCCDSSSLYRVIAIVRPSSFEFPTRPCTTTKCRPDVALIL